MEGPGENSDHGVYNSKETSGRYEIKWTNFRLPSASVLLKFMWAKARSTIPGKEELDKYLPVTKPNWKELDETKTSTDGICVVWLGHACVLVQLDGMRILTDPVFSSRCGPTLGYQMGPKRYRDPPCTVKELPKFDAVVISHNHYDHLDLQTVRDINDHIKTNHLDVTWFVPKGLKEWMSSSGCEIVVELDWWECHSLNNHKFTFVPAQHWSRRTALDYNKSLWGGWCIKGSKHSFYFAGDTGYDDGLFKEIGKELGPFDLAAIPIGAYWPRECMTCQHVNPEQAFSIHEDVKAKKSIGIHWGTFHLSTENWLEPKQKIEELRTKKQDGKEEINFFTLNPGGSVFLKDMP